MPSILTLRYLYCIFHLNDLQYSNPTTAVSSLKMRSFRELLSYYSQGTSLQQNITPVPYDQHIHFNLNPQQFGMGMAWLAYPQKWSNSLIHAWLSLQYLKCAEFSNVRGLFTKTPTQTMHLGQGSHPSELPYICINDPSNVEEQMSCVCEDDS